MQRANDIEYWKALARERGHTKIKLDSGYLLIGLHGWHYGTYWIDGTPATLLGHKIREEKLIVANWTF